MDVTSPWEPVRSPSESEPVAAQPHIQSIPDLGYHQAGDSTAQDAQAEDQWVYVDPSSYSNPYSESPIYASGPQPEPTNEPHYPDPAVPEAHVPTQAYPQAPQGHVAPPYEQPTQAYPQAPQGYGHRHLRAADSGLSAGSPGVWAAPAYEQPPQAYPQAPQGYAAPAYEQPTQAYPQAPQGYAAPRTSSRLRRIRRLPRVMRHPLTSSRPQAYPQAPQGIWRHRRAAGSGVSAGSAGVWRRQRRHRRHRGPARFSGLRPASRFLSDQRIGKWLCRCTPALSHATSDRFSSFGYGSGLRNRAPSAGSSGARLECSTGTDGRHGTACTGGRSTPE